MAAASVLTDIRSMIDFAIGTPEAGVVDFCMLHTVLHCLAQQINALDKPVELMGGVPSVVSAPARDVQTVAITEYIVQTDTDTPLKPKTIKPPPPAAGSTLLVVERVKKDSSQEQSSASPTRTLSPSRGAKTLDHPPSTKAAKAVSEAHVESGREDVGPEAGGAEEGRVAGPPRQITSTEKLSLVTLSKFNLLEGAVQDLKDRVYGSMPKNEQILEEVRSQTNLKAITDMWTNLNVSSRLEAAETGLTKLSSLVEDLIREGNQGTSAPKSTVAAAGRPSSATAAARPSSATPAAPPSKVAAAAPPSTATATAPPSTATATAPPSTDAAAAPPSTATAAAPPSTVAAAAPPPAATPASLVETGAVNVVQTYFDQAQMGLAQFGPPYPWETIAAQQSYERDVMLQQLQRLRDDLDLLNKTFYDAMETIQDNIDIKGDVQLAPPPPPSPPPPLPPVIQQLPPMAPIAPPAAIGRRSEAAPALESRRSEPAPAAASALASRRSEAAPAAASALASRRSEAAPASAPASALVSRRSSGVTAALADRLAQLEHRVKECCDGMGKDRGVAGDQMGNFQDQLDHLMRQVAALHEDFAVLKLSPNLAKDLEGLMQLYQTVQDMQEQLRQVNEVARQLAGEKDERQNHIKALLEQIEILKTIKLDREDMAEAMAEKADLRMLARKVSHDQFEMACDDLSRGLEHALGKLNSQEALWQQVLDDVQREIESKLDKMELSPLKDFFENKLRLLQDNLKQMASLRRNVEAAGTTRRLLRDVNCISCDADAVMPMENTSAMPSKPLPAHLSMKPYLSYELDSIRKTQASNLPQRNLHDWETIEKQKAPKAPVKVRSDTDKHICNRYCGGSHTTTTAAQRVARTGHFIKQWGPDVVPLSSGMAAGDDGRLYKVSTTENANVGPGGSVEPCTKKPKAPEPAKPPPKPVVISNKECRCLD